jgi:HSP20 family protein
MICFHGGKGIRSGRGPDWIDPSKGSCRKEEKPMFSLMPWRRERERSGLVPRTERPLSFFRGDLDELFDRFFARLPMPVEEKWLAMTGMEVEETDEAELVRTDAPGFEPNEFSIEVSGDTLKITAEHKVAGKEKEPTIERRLSRFVTLPAAVDPDKVEARYRHGVLEIKLPRTEPAKHRKVEVKVE